MVVTGITACLPARLSVSEGAGQPACLSVCVSTACLSLTVCLSGCMSACLRVYLYNNNNEDEGNDIL